MAIIKVLSTTKLSTEQVKKIESLFASKHSDEQINFVYEIDSSLIGGILVIDGDKYYDGSMRGQLLKFRTAIK